MPSRVSSDPKDAFHFRGFKAGWAEVTDAAYEIFQFPPNRETGRQMDPALYLRLDVQRITGKGGTSDGTDPEAVYFLVAFADKTTHLVENFHVGGGNRDDEIPQDLGNALGTVGPTLMAIKDGEKLSDNTGYMKFCQSLVSKGYKADVMRQSWAPDFIGLQAMFEQKVGEANAKAEKGKDMDYMVVTEIGRFPWEVKNKTTAAKKGPKPAAAKQDAPAASAPASAASAAPASTAPSAAPPAELEGIITNIVAGMAVALAGTTVPVMKFRTSLVAALAKDPEGRRNMASANAAIKDIPFLTRIGEETGFFTVQDDGVLWSDAEVVAALLASRESES